MNSEYVISCCSTADMPKEYFEKRKIRYICFHYQLDGVSYPDDFGESIPFDDFYKAMQNGADTKTSQVNVEEYEEYFKRVKEMSFDIIKPLLFINKEA